jgi:molybdopterin converting factor small subunit
VDPSVNLYVNEEDIRALQGLDTPLQVGDELVILLAMSGG